MIEEIGESVQSGAPDQRRDCVDDQSKPILGLLDFVKGFLQRLPCEVLLGDIDTCTTSVRPILVHTRARIRTRLVRSEVFQATSRDIGMTPRFLLSTGRAEFEENARSCFHAAFQAARPLDRVGDLFGQLVQAG